MLENPQLKSVQSFSSLIVVWHCIRINFGFRINVPNRLLNIDEIIELSELDRNCECRNSKGDGINRPVMECVVPRATARWRQRHLSSNSKSSVSDFNASRAYSNCSERSEYEVTPFSILFIALTFGVYYQNCVYLLIPSLRTCLYQLDYSHFGEGFSSIKSIKLTASARRDSRRILLNISELLTLKRGSRTEFFFSNNNRNNINNGSNSHLETV